MKKHATKRALLMSVLSLLLCASMLIGTTFAWFTDSVTSGRNQIAAGNLDVTLDYWNGSAYEEVTTATKLFNDAALWEPGHTEVAYLKVGNAGSLALLYQLAVNVYSETKGHNVNNEAFALSDYLVFSVVEKKIETTDDLFTREEAVKAAGTTMGLATYNSGDKTLLNTNEADYVALIIYMPESVGNEANYKTGTTAPSIEMGVTLVATQKTHEQDSFGQDYDTEAYMPIPVVPGAVTPFDFQGFSFSVPTEAVKPGVTGLIPAVTNPVRTVNIPNDTVTTKTVSIAVDIAINGLKEDNTAPITISYTIPEDGEYYESVSVYHNGVKIADEDVSFDAATRTVTFTTTSFSPFEIVLDTGATVIPESYTNDDAVALLQSAQSGAAIDGLGRTITFPNSTKNVAAGFSIPTKNLTLRNMTLTAGGTGFTVQIDARNQTIVMQNVKFTFSGWSGQGAVELTTNAKNSVLFEDCTFEKKVYIQGANITFDNCTFKANNNLESASNVTIKNCDFTVATNAVTLNSGLKNILIENCTFKSKPIKIYDNMAQPTNVQLLNNTYTTSLYYSIGVNVNLDAWKAAGAWIESGNVTG